MLLNVIAGAIGRDAFLRLASNQPVDWHPERFPYQVPKSQIHAADGVHGTAGPPIRNGGAPHNIPVTLHIEWIFPDQQLLQMLLNDRSTARAAAPIAFQSFVGGDL